jgi:gamma-glutamyltranspeptidase / glutathione hydrolase
MKRSLLAVWLLGVVACSPATQEPLQPDPNYSAKPLASVTALPSATVSSPPPGVRWMPKGAAEAPRVALGTKGAVTSQEAHATDIGIEVLKQGGSAVDAAIAVGFALAVTHPSAGNIGGGGFMVVRMNDGSKAALDYREMAPSGASRDMYLDKDGKETKDSKLGPKAAGIPGTIAGFAAAHEKFGKLPWKDLVAPSIKLAKEGFPIDKVLADDLARVTKQMREAKYDSTAKLFEKADGSALAEGDKLVQADLAKVLEAVAKDGPKAFYEGKLADNMAKEVKKAGGIWKSADLKSYKAKWREPIVFTYKGNEIVTMPPPSSGGVVLKEMLVMSEALGIDKKPWRSADEVHLFTEVMRRAYADRNYLLGDPDFVSMPLQQIMDPAYLKKRVADVDPKKATKSDVIKPGVEQKAESTQTTHYSVVDEAGNAVSNTYTLNTGYGAKFAIPGTGVLLNNEMNDFAVVPGKPNTYGLVQGELNRVEPGKRMLSSMTPTIISKDGQLRAVIGTPGGPTITTTVAQITRALLDYGITLDKATPAFRAHHQWQPDQIWAEPTMPDDVMKELEARGHTVKRERQMGHANGIEVDPETHGFRAVSDTTRKGGKAAAY